MHVWLLLACVLFNLMACGQHHGQMSGELLQAAQMEPCADMGGMSHDMPMPASHHAELFAMLGSCPLCSAFAVLPAASMPGWTGALTDAARAPLRIVVDVVRPPPRLHSTAINPRAPPVSIAVS